MADFSELQAFLQYLKLERGYSRATVAAYASDLKQYFNSKTPDPTSYIATLRQSGLALRSIHRKLSALSSYFDFLIRTGKASDNPAAAVELAHYAAPPPDAPASQEIQTLFEKNLAPENPGFVALLMLRMLYACGLRVSELTQSTAGHLDLEKGLLRVLGKGGKTRLVPIDAATVSLLKTYCGDVRPLRASKSASQTDALFLTLAGRPYTRQAVWKALKRTALENGIASDLSPHSLRHAYATHCLENGMNLRTLQMLLGHSDISTTQIYTTVTNRHLRESLEKFHPRARSKKPLK